jgi:iron complex transport system ATP-binding protein
LDDLHRIAQSGTTLILVTHHMHEILPCIKRTVLLEKGRVAFDGPTSQAMESRLLSQVFGCALRSVQTPNGYWQVNMEAV